MDPKLLASTVSRIAAGNIVWLDLTSQNVTDNNLKEIAAAISSENSTISKLVLDDNDLFGSDVYDHDSGFIALLEALSLRSKLVTLHLNNVQMPSAALLDLALYLASQGTHGPKFISLQDNNFKYSEVKLLVKMFSMCTSLQTLSLDDNQFGDEGCIYLAQMLNVNTGLLSLSLANVGMTELGLQALGGALENHCALQVLQISENNIGDVGAIALSALLSTNKSLRQIHASSCQITDYGAAAIFSVLEHNGSVRKLSLDGNSLNSAVGLEKLLKNNRTLETLCLKNNAYSCATLAAVFVMLPHNPMLKELDLEANKLADASIIILARYLPANDSLILVNLASNNITASAAISLLEASKLHQHIQRIDLSNNLFGPAEVEHIVAGHDSKRVKYVLKSELDDQIELVSDISTSAASVVSPNLAAVKISSSFFAAPYGVNSTTNSAEKPVEYATKMHLA